MTPSKKQPTVTSLPVEKELQQQQQHETSTEEETSNEEQVSMEKEDNNLHTKSKSSKPAASSSAGSVEVKKSRTPKPEKQNETYIEEEISAEEEEDDHDEEIEETSKPEPSKKYRTATDEKKSSGSQSKLFKRFWSEEDELVVLKEMAYFSSKKGKDPSIHCESFLSFVKDKLQANPTTAQLKDKMYRLKKRFQTNSRRYIISNPHEKKVFQLSKKVWDVDNSQQGENPNKPKSKHKLRPETDMQGGHEVVVLEESRDYGRDLLFSEMSKILNVDELKRGMRFLKKSKRKKLEKEWMDLHDEENDLVVKRSRITAEHVEVIVEVLKSSRS